jgi:mannosyl-3-phosphoglycerate phosphatase
MGFIIFTDLDGTLLDHHSYRWDEAVPALERIRAEGWPLIPVTSKTRAEVAPLRAELRLDDPFVVENGGGVFLPDRAPWSALGDPLPESDGVPLRCLTLGRPYSEIRSFVQRHGAELGIRGFGDVDAAVVARWTGLDTAAAALARSRDFTEPFLLEDEGRLGEVRARARDEGLSVTSGGRFHHLMGAGQDKGRAVRILHRCWIDGADPEARSVALGDGTNDVPMLEAADEAVRIPAPGRPLPRVSRSDARTAPHEGPAGWSAALLDLFDTSIHSTN